MKYKCGGRGLTSEAELRAAFVAHGVTAMDVRDGAHEATHALEWGVEPPWTRARVAAAAGRKSANAKFESEVLARAVEQLVCEAVGAECPPLEERAFVALLEGAKRDGYMVDSIQVWMDMVTARMKSAEARDMVQRILALPSLP